MQSFFKILDNFRLGYNLQNIVEYLSIAVLLLFICTDKTNLKMPQPQYLPLILRQIFEGQENVIKFSPPNNWSRDWSQKLWLYLKQHFLNNLSQFEGLPILPANETTFLQLSQSKPVLLASKRATYFMLPSTIKLPDDVVSIVTKLDVTLIPSLPVYIEQHPCVLDNYVMLPDIGGVLNTLVAMAQQEFPSLSNTWQNWQYHKFEKLSAVEKIIFRKFIANVASAQSKSNFKNDWQNFCRHLQLFELDEEMENCIKKFTSIAMCSKMASKERISSLPLLTSLLDASDTSAVTLASWFGIQPMSTEEVLVEIIFPNVTDKFYSNQQLETLIEVIIPGYLNKRYKNNTISKHMWSLKFIPTNLGNVKSPSELYDSSDDLLRKLFEGQDVFPSDSIQHYLPQLLKLGMKTRANVTDVELLSIAKDIQLQPSDTKSEALLYFIKATISHATRMELSRLNWLAITWERPKNYPNSLPWAGKQGLFSAPNKVVHTAYADMCGSVCIFPKNHSNVNSIFDILGVRREPDVQSYIDHLSHIVENYNSSEKSQYFPIVINLYEKLQTNSATEYLRLNASNKWVWYGDGFCKPSRCFIDKVVRDMSPHAFCLPEEVKRFLDFFRQCGVRDKVDKMQLLNWIAEWYAKEENCEICAEQVLRDTQLVIEILNEIRDDIKSNKLKLNEISNQIYVPVEMESKSFSLVKPANCTYYDGEWLKLQKDTVEYEDLQIIHHDIPIATAQCLGIPSLTSRLIRAEELELEFESYGQSEPLTTRLKNLIKDYSDGLSVLKEFVQNADDAGATEVRFLIDERENLNARTFLLDKKFSPCQGPAIVVYNNATFSDDDFRNIIKIGGATKENNAQKIGQFGLGFNSVYNITDVPCFLSRNFLAIFDPHMKYISNASTKKSNPGVRILLDNLIKHSAVYGDQIKPFQNIFECNIGDKINNYPGTLFRLPLRTPDEARESEICKKHYSRDDVFELFKLLLDNGQNILMFTQNVKKIELYHLKNINENPTQMKLLYRVTKTGLNKLQTSLTACSNDDFQFLKQAEEVIKKQGNNFPVHGLNASLVIELASVVTQEGNLLLRGKGEEIKSTTNWLISQSVGKGESFSMAKSHAKLLPVAGVAIKLVKYEDGYQPVCLIPTSEDPGVLFCFLPLPELPSPALPVHLNGCFALSSSRRHLMAVYEKDKKDFRAQWNYALFVDAVIEAYINAVINLRLIVGAYVNDIFSLWPIAEQNNKQFIPLMTDKFYEHVALSDIQLFPHQSNWKSFRECKILDGNFRFSPAGEIAQKVLVELSEKNYCGAVVELPRAQWFRLQALVQEKRKENLINPICFFEEYFLPHIECLNRSLVDYLLMYALFSKDYDFGGCLKRFACIPVKPFGKFKHISNLIHPYGLLAPLFEEVEECFPEWSEQNTSELSQFCLGFIKQTSLTSQNFCHSLYGALVDLGMKSHDIPIDQLKEKTAATKSHLINLKPYSNAILQVLEKKIKDKLLSIDDIAYFKTVSFLPVKMKPKNCPIKWYGDNYSSTLITNASSLFLEEISPLICCIAPIIDGSQVSVSKTICKALGIEDKNVISFDLVLQQFIAINDSISDLKHTIAADCFDFVRYVCHNIYKYLLQRLEPEIELQLFDRFHDIPFILIGDKLIKPSLCSFNLKFSCDPYLFGLSDKLEYTKTFKQLMKSVGVEDSFNSAQYNQCLQFMHDKHGNNKLSVDDLQKAINISYELIRALDMEQKNVEQLQEKHGPVYLPDENGILRESSELVYNETPWLEEKQVGLNFINGKLGYDILKRLGGKTLREDILNKYMLPFVRPFGQKEKLTTRLKKIISDYPNDESILRELLQNADDAGCSEIHFILDPRNHKGEKVFSEEWKQLQGPSLLVLNDKCFSNEDLEGIQNLGEGGKGNDSLKTGRYGVGFNCVYHLTDCPSLLTSTPTTGPVLGVFDPHNKFMPSATHNNPGCLFNDVEKLKILFPDAFSCYVDKLLPKQATAFRFPLRTEHQAKTSLISKQVVSIDQIKSLFEKFKKDAHDCLLFLRNITTIKISIINEKLSLQTFYVQSSLQAEDLMKRNRFNEKVIQYSKLVKLNSVNLLKKIDDNKVHYELSIADSYGKDSKWLVLQQFGLSQAISVKKEIMSAIEKSEIGMLLQGGVALKLTPNIKAESASNSNKMRLFCFLPLPLLTHLPVHINGFFALDHEARRGLFRDGENSLSTYRSLWNALLMEQVIAPAYVEILAQVKNKLVVVDNTSRSKIRSSLQAYLALFPRIDSNADEYLNILAKAAYKHMADNSYQLFPTLRSSSCNALSSVSWLDPISDTSELKPVFDTLQANNSVREILLDCGMNIVELPWHVHTTCKQALSEISKEFCEVSPPMMKEFFVTSGKIFAQSIMPTLPKSLKETPLKKSENVVEILKYFVNQNASLPDLSNMQLLVTEDEVLRCYSSQNPIFVTPNFNLIPTRKDLFINEHILKFLSGKELNQASLKKFDLNNLVELLPEYLSKDKWHGPQKRVLINKETNEMIDWAAKVWAFIGECLTENSCVSKNNILQYLSNIHEWCLFPAIENNKQKILYPVGKAKAVIDLTYGDPVSQKIRNSLDMFGIPKPDYSIFRNYGFNRLWTEGVGEKMIKMLAGDISDPGSIIYAIGNLLDNGTTLPMLNPSQCDLLLNYFVTDLSKVKNTGNSVQILQRLPCYQTIFYDRSDLYGKCVYVIPNGIPQLTRKNFHIPPGITFLSDNLKFIELYMYLGCKALTVTEFYCQHMFPLLETSSDCNERNGHMCFVRDNFKLLPQAEKNAIQNYFQIQRPKLFPNLKNELKMASELMDSSNPIFCSFHNMDPDFPHTPYDGIEWRSFLIMAGLIHDITPQGLLVYARELSSSDLQDIASVTKKAKVLLRYIFMKSNQLEV